MVGKVALAGPPADESTIEGIETDQDQPRRFHTLSRSQVKSRH